MVVRSTPMLILYYYNLAVLQCMVDSSLCWFGMDMYFEITKIISRVRPFFSQCGFVVQ